jgi:hypothetical protein
MLQRLRISLFFLLALSMLSATARAGSRYFFCSTMGEARTDACCTHRADQSSTSPAVEKTTHACCESHVVAKLPPSTLESAVRVAPPVLASVSLFACDELRASMPAREPRREFHAHPPNPPDARSRTMVFLI